MRNIQDTSAKAYYSVLQTLGYKQEMVYLKLKELGDATNNEIAQAMGLPINRITPRVHELRKLGVVQEAFRRPCKVTGMSAIAWELVRK